MKFVGLKNYRRLLLNDPLFWRSFLNSIIILFVGGFFVFFLGFLLSVMINSGIKGKNFFRAFIFLPNVIATVALTTLWAWVIYSPQFGIIGKTLNLIGFHAASKFLWLAPNNVFNSMVIAIIWISVSYYVVLILAGMDKIPTDFYEAAKLEGANQFTIFRTITIPMIWDVVIVSSVLWGISALKTFEFPFSFMSSSEDPHLYTLNVYLFIMGFGKRQPIYQLGYATAIGVILLIVVIIFNIAVRRIGGRDRLEY